MLTEINIPNFRGLGANFVLNPEYIKRFNLITGLNGIGKTALLRNINDLTNAKVTKKAVAFSNYYFLNQHDDKSFLESLINGNYFAKGILFDNIDFGLHYTKMLPFWSEVFQKCKANNIQLFATTHSLEMIQAYVKATKDCEMQDEISLFQMYVSGVSGNVVAVSHDYESIAFRLERNMPLRGELRD